MAWLDGDGQGVQGLQSQFFAGRVALQLSRGPRTHDSSLAQHSGALRIAREQITQVADDLMNGLTVGAGDAARDEAAMAGGGRAPPLRAAMPSRSLRTMSLSRAPQLQAAMGNFRWPFNTGTPVRRRWRPSRRRNPSWPWCPTDIRGQQRSRDESNQAEASSSGNGIKYSVSSSASIIPNSVSIPSSSSPTSSSFAVLSNAVSSSVQVSTGDSSDGLLLGAPHSLQNLPEGSASSAPPLAGANATPKKNAPSKGDARARARCLTWFSAISRRYLHRSPWPPFRPQELSAHSTALLLHRDCKTDSTSTSTSTSNTTAGIRVLICFAQRATCSEQWPAL